MKSLRIGASKASKIVGLVHGMTGGDPTIFQIAGLIKIDKWYLGR